MYLFTYRELNNLSKEIHITNSIVNRIANSGEIYKGYTFKITNNK